MRTSAPRIQLSFDEKIVMAERIKKSDKADEDLIVLMHEWNSHNPQRPINLKHLCRIRDSIPEISNQDEFWESVKSEVDAMLLQVTCEAFKVGSKKDKKGRDTKVMDNRKLPFITEAQLNQLIFKFQEEAYSRPGKSGRFTESTKLLNDHFRKHFLGKGMALAPFSSFMNREEQKTLSRLVGDFSQWVPSETEGVWKTISEAVVETEFKDKLFTILKPAFSDEDRAEDRLNPNFRVLQEVVEKLDKPNKSDVQAGLYKVRCFARRAFSTLDFAS